MKNQDIEDMNASEIAKTVFFQKDGQNDHFVFWQGNQGNSTVRLTSNSENLYVSEISSISRDWMPGCEVEDSGITKCKCLFTNTMEENAHELCPWRVLEESTDFYGSFETCCKLIDGKVTGKEMLKALKATAHPEMGDDASLVALVQKKWRFMDEGIGRVVFDGLSADEIKQSGIPLYEDSWD